MTPIHDDTWLDLFRDWAIEIPDGTESFITRNIDRPEVIFYRWPRAPRVAPLTPAQFITLRMMV